MELKYNRILLKISGEALGGEKGSGFDEAAWIPSAAASRRPMTWVSRSASW